MEEARPGEKEGHGEEEDTSEPRVSDFIGNSHNLQNERIDVVKVH